ncbi:putative DNA-binding transcriptional regulator YafY [Rubricella aquisinus]|uniref:Putative DNA-binding transcriptional regulator YafY n=1 Tax=Rubricella aquisinus TaxID=2028108 RepID=A0A840WKK4_9RHOB|nr:WYL domain-containing protein [Rubricella aquisinus]MBB5515051.1 putative DNA-binding transcriptional regulator YafY [Rubricella aquisinus]
MARANAYDRLKRLESLAVQLKQDTHCTAKDLAALHGVSLRTITRDLALMREQGMQIDADRGRGGGVRLDRNWGVGRLNLSYAEAVDLLISIAVAERMNSPMFLANLGAVQRQLVASFSPEKRARVNRLKSRILIGVTASPFVQASAETLPKRVVQTLHQAFVERERLDIRYRREDGAVSTRVIEPHYLLLKYPIWYIVAMDRLRAGPRTFRCDRVLRATREGTQFQVLPKDHFAPSLTEDDLSPVA